MLTDGQSFLVSLFTQALFYGIYLATLIQCFRWLIFTDEGWKLKQRINHVMTFATIFIFLMFTINLATVLLYELDNFLGAGESWDRFATVMVMDVTSLLATIAVDGVLIFRCWVVYAKSFRAICVPFIFWLASLACSALYAYFAGLYYTRQFSPQIVQNSSKAITGLYSCNIAITIYTTTAIIYRIFSAKKNSGSSPKRLNYVARILAESGILYTSVIIFSMVTTVLIERDDATWVEFLIAQIAQPLAFSTAGITFNLLLIRVYKNRVESRDSSAESSDVCKERTLTEGQFNNPYVTGSLSEEPSFNTTNTLYDAMDEVQELRRGRNGMHEN